MEDEEGKRSVSDTIIMQGMEVNLEAVFWVGCSLREARNRGDNVRQKIKWSRA